VTLVNPNAMNKNLLLLSALVIGLSSCKKDDEPQADPPSNGITLNSSDVPTIGTTFYYATDTLSPAIGPGAAGKIMTWDFTGLIDAFTDTTDFVNPSTTSLGGSFPTATLAIKESRSGLNWVYLKNDAHALSVLGVAVPPLPLIGGPGNPLVLSNNLDMMRFSTTYCSKFSDIAYGDSRWPGIPFVLDSIRVVSYWDISVLDDAYGQVTIPTGTYEVQRLKSTQINVDSIFFSSTSGWDFQFEVIDTTWAYQFVTNNKGWVVVDFEVDGTGKTIQTRYKK